MVCSVSLALWDWLDKENRIGTISNSSNASVLLKASRSMCEVICVHASSKCLAHADVYSHHVGLVLEFLGSLGDVALALGHVFYDFSFQYAKGKKIWKNICCNLSGGDFTL